MIKTGCVERLKTHLAQALFLQTLRYRPSIRSLGGDLSIVELRLGNLIFHDTSDISYCYWKLRNGPGQILKSVRGALLLNEDLNHMVAGWLADEFEKPAAG